MILLQDLKCVKIVFHFFAYEAKFVEWIIFHAETMQLLFIIFQLGLYNNCSETRNLIRQYPCRMKQSCTGYLKVDIASHFTRMLRA